MQPHQGLEDEAVDKLLQGGEYPSVSEVPLGDVMTKCWRGVFDSADKVAKEISHSGIFPTRR